MYDKIKRPAFLYNTGVQITGDAPSIENINKRVGNGNDKMVRPAFYQAAVQPRNLVSFDKLKAIDLDGENQMISKDKDGDKMAVFNVRFPDPQDSIWINEKNRIVADLKTKNKKLKPSEIEAFLQINKPLGRDQRSIMKKTNLFDSNMSLKRTIDIMYDDLNSNQYVSNILQNTVKKNLERVMDNGKNLYKLERKAIEELDFLVKKAKIPVSHTELGLIPRFVDYNYYMINAGKINLLLFSVVSSSKQSKNYNYEYLVKNLAMPPGARGYSLQEAVYLMENDSRDGYMYLDLHLCGLIDEDQLKANVKMLQNGWDSDLISIAEGSRPRGYETLTKGMPEITPQVRPEEEEIVPLDEEVLEEKKSEPPPDIKPDIEPPTVLPAKPKKKPKLPKNILPQFAPPRYDLAPNEIFVEEMRKAHPSFSEEKLKEYSKKTFERLPLDEKKNLIQTGRVKLTPQQTVYYLERKGKQKQ